jgi:hypothetical protein
LLVFWRSLEPEAVGLVQDFSNFPRLVRSRRFRNPRRMRS